MRADDSFELSIKGATHAEAHRAHRLRVRAARLWRHAASSGGRRAEDGSVRLGRLGAARGGLGGDWEGR